jgi:TonB dependent receptor/Carboxypeptidase regulatory-like domain/TonB-dependent Receptor Plug Domain
MKIVSLAAMVAAMSTAHTAHAQSRVALMPAGVQAGYTALSATPAGSGPLATPVTISATQKPVGAILMEIVSQARLSFASDAAQPGMEVRRDLQVSRVSARDAIQRLLEGTPFRAMVGPAGQIVVVRRPPPPPRDDDASAALQQGPKVRLSGYVRSAASREFVRRAQLSADNETIRVESNEDGFYTLLLSTGTHRLRIRAIGFAPKDTTVTLTSNVTADLLMEVRKVTLAAVTVQASKGDDRPDLDPRTPDMSVIRLDLAAVKLLPPVLGEPDPIRSLTLLPGVSLSSDASTSFSVRGGAADQNLFLLDEATIYNPAHILGFLSTFNTDAVDNVTLYKGAIPAKFGGRLSSVVDVRQREGNANEFVGTASIGLLASRVALEGPLPKRSGSYMIAARRSYADIFLGLASDTTLRDTRAYFYDVNAKANFRLGSTGALLLSGYIGRDLLSPQRGNEFSWGNVAGTLRWNQAIGGRLFQKVTAAVGSYDYRLQVPFATRDSLTWDSSIGSLDLKIDETYNLSPNNTIEFGVQVANQEFRPGKITPRGRTNLLRPREVGTRYGIAPAAYLGQDLKLGERFAVRYGVRYAGFLRNGPATTYKYANNAPVTYNRTLDRYESANPTDSTIFKSGQRVRSVGGFEPRISGRIMLTDESSLKASYARTQQFLLLASNTNSLSPLDIWEPVGTYIDPQRADQFALGYSANRTGYELSVEGYYKKASNVIDFIDGSDVILNPRLETILVQGTGRAYGLELFARRTTGTITGWISYTIGRAEQRFPVPPRAGAVTGGGINGGRWYPSPFDKTHNLSVVLIRPLGKKWTLGSTFSLATGLPLTLPVGRYLVDGIFATELGARNSGRLPLYHRLDLSATRTFSRGELQLGVLNAYNRFNAQSLRFRQQSANPLVTEARQTAIFGIVPSISYVFHF